MINEKSITFNNTAGSDFRINNEVTAASSGSFKHFRIIARPAGATVKIKTLHEDGLYSSAFSATDSDIFDFGVPVSKLTMICDTVGVVTYQASLNDTMRTANTQNITATASADVEGLYANNSQLNPYSSIKPVLVGMVNPSGAGNNHVDTLQSADQMNVNAQPAVIAASTLSFLANATKLYGFPTTGTPEQVPYTILAINAQTVPAGATLTVSGTIGGQTRQLNVYTAGGVSVGIISAVGLYYVNMAGLDGTSMTANNFLGGATIVAQFCYSPYNTGMINATTLLYDSSTVGAASPLPVTSGYGSAGVAHGVQNVTTAGTRVTFASNLMSFGNKLTIKAKSTNTGLIYVGAATVSSANGFQLSAGDTVSLAVTNNNAISLDSAVNGEGVSWIAEA